MPLSTFEKLLPWSGALAGLLWAVQMVTTAKTDDPADPAAVTVVRNALARNDAAGFALLAGALLLVLFATAVRTALRSGEAGESTYSSVAYGGLLVAATGFAGFGVAQIAMTNAADARDAAATATIGQFVLIGWLPALVGMVACFWGLGLGGLRTATVPRWFGIVCIVLGVLGVLGPLAAVVYLLLPLWLIAASVVVARSVTVPARQPAAV